MSVFVFFNAVFGHFFQGMRPNSTNVCGGKGQLLWRDGQTSVEGRVKFLLREASTSVE